MILLDTSVFIEYFRRANKENTYFYRLSQVYEAFSISSITKYEILVGRKGDQESFWEQLFDKVSPLPFGANEAKEAASIHQYLLEKNKIIGFRDTAIAATSIVHGFPIATLNVKHFK